MKKTPVKKKVVAKAKVVTAKPKKSTVKKLEVVLPKVEAIEPCFLPKDNEFCLCVPCLDHTGIQITRFNHRVVEIIDLGVNLVVPEGYRLRAEVIQQWATRGLLIYSAFTDQNNRLKLSAVNLGRETPLVVGHKEPVARVWLEPIVNCWSV